MVTSWRRRLLLGGFLCLAAVHLVALLIQCDTVASWSKPVPILLLATYAWAAGAPRLLLAGLLFSAAGDVALDSEPFFLIGMGLFGVAQLAYVALFVRYRRTLRWTVLAAYLVAWATLILLLWPGLGELRVPAALYSLLLTTMAVTAAGVSLRVAIGGALFWVSDALIATGLAGWDWLPVPDLWVMSTYFAAQYVFGSQSYAAERSRAGWI